MNDSQDQRYSILNEQRYPILNESWRDKNGVHAQATWRKQAGLQAQTVARLQSYALGKKPRPLESEDFRLVLHLPSI